MAHIKCLVAAWNLEPKIVCAHVFLLSVINENGNLELETRKSTVVSLPSSKLGTSNSVGPTFFDCQQSVKVEAWNS